MSGLSGEKILFTGATGQVARPVAEGLAADNEVWCAARFGDESIRSALESSGIRTVRWSMEAASLEELPSDFTLAFHAAPYRGQPDTETVTQANAVATGRLMEHCRSARAFVFISTFAVYQKPARADHPVAETDPLGGYAPYAPSYPIGKLAAEAVVRAFAPVFDLPSTIARLNVCYGPTGWGGLPVEMLARVAADEPIYLLPSGDEIWSSPISTDDVLGFTPALFDVASTAPTIVNLAGDEAVTLPTFVDELAARAGLRARYVRDDRARSSFLSDNTRRRELLGDCTVHWREGMARAVDAHMPGLASGERPASKSAGTNIWGAS